MKSITKNEMNEIVRKGEDQLILFYKENHAPSALLMETFRSVDSLIGKSFSCYTVNFDLEPEIVSAFDVKEAPEIIAMKNTRIHKRENALQYTNQILDLLK